MANLIRPQNLEKESSTPEWMDASKIIEAADADSPRIKKEASSAPVLKEPEEVISRLACIYCHKAFFPNHEELVKQASEAKEAGEEVSYTCPSCGRLLAVANTIPRRPKYSSQRAATFDIKRVDLRGRENNATLTPDYAPFALIDRHIILRAQHELGKYAREAGMIDVHMRFQRSEHKPNGLHPDALRTASYLIDYLDPAGVHSSALAEVSITPQGQILLPKSFKTAAGEEFLFTKEAVEALARGRTFEKLPMDLDQKSMEPHLRDPDITRFRVLTASDKEAHEGGLLEDEPTPYETPDEIFGGKGEWRGVDSLREAPTVIETTEEEEVAGLVGAFASEKAADEDEKTELPDADDLSSEAAFDTRDEATGVPVLDTDTVDIGMTEFPEFAERTVDEAMQDILKDRPEWANRGRMPHRDRTRYELEQGGDSKFVRGDPELDMVVEEPTVEPERMGFEGEAALLADFEKFSQDITQPIVTQEAGGQWYYQWPAGTETQAMAEGPLESMPTKQGPFASVDEAQVAAQEEQGRVAAPYQQRQPWEQGV